MPKEKNVFEVGGAYINCWIDATNIKIAKSIANRNIEESSWQIDNLEEGYEVTEKDYENKPEGFESYQQALLDKEVYVFHTYPAEDTK